MLKDRAIEVKENVKNHIKRNKDAYYVCAIIVVAGVTFVVTRRITKSTTIINTVAPIFHNDIGNAPYLSGNMKKVIRNDNTDIIWESISACAYGEGKSRSLISKHVNGHIPHAGGERYTIIGIATN